jgi:hypothetical protein
MRQIPLSIPHDVERDEAFARISAQIREVHSLLATCPPPEPEHASPPGEET